MMCDSEDEEILLDSGLAVWYALTNRNIRRYSTHPINEKRCEFGEFHHLYQDLRLHPQRFFEYMRMTINTFDYIVQLIDEKLAKEWRNCHKRPIFTEERLMLTIRYLSTGTSFRGLAFTFRMGKSTVSMIIQETVRLLWEVLQPIHMKVPTEEDFLKIADDFYNIWNFPHCVGAIDGKHIRINNPKHSGSMYYNYKSFFSIVLQGIADANYKFITIDVGGYGKQSDGGTFRASSVFSMLQNKKLNIPKDDVLPSTSITAPYVFVGDEAYPLLENLLKPFSRQQLDSNNEYFNKRLSRTRRTIECTFGMIYAKWRLLAKSIETDVDTADEIVKAICVLHNTIIDKEGMEHHLNNISLFPKGNHQHIPTGRPTAGAQLTRDIFKEFVCKNPIIGEG